MGNSLEKLPVPNLASGVTDCQISAAPMRAISHGGIAGMMLGQSTPANQGDPA